MSIQIGVVTQVDLTKNIQKVRAVLDSENMVNLSIEQIQKYRSFPVKVPVFRVGEVILSEDKITEMNAGKRDLLVDFIHIEWFDSIHEAVTRALTL